MYSADEKLVSQTLAGDRDAFGMLVHKYQEIVYSYAFQKVRNEADAQDITQEIFLQAYRCLYQLRQPHLFRSWLYTIMSNECKRWLKQVTKNRRRETALEETANEALQVKPAHSAPVEGWQVDLEQAMSALPDENRVAVSMFYMGDCSLKEISEFLGVSVNTVKGKLYRARQQLGAAMSQHYGKLLKSHKLRGGFLMQFMEQIRHVPAPAMGFAWSSASVGKTLFALITALCILIGFIEGRANLQTESPMNQTEVVAVSSNRWPIEVTLLTPAVNSARTSISDIPAPMGKRPLEISSRGSTAQTGRSIDRAETSNATSGKVLNPQLSAAMAKNSTQNQTFFGRVVDSNGEPVTDADILYGSTRPVTRTSADGTFRFESIRPERKALYEEFDSVRIVAKHPDFAIGWQNAQPQNTANLEIQLSTPGVISGRVADMSDNLIQNAVVQIRYLLRDNDQLSWGRGDYLTADVIAPAKTNANGEFVLRGLPQGGVAEIDVHAYEYAQQNFRVQIDAKGIEFQLKREARIEGHVSYAETGLPVTEATVGFARITSPDRWGQTRVDANGNYLLKELGPGVYSLYLDKAPDGWTALSARLVEIDEGQTVSGIDLALVRGGIITGQVIDLDTNEPIVNHHVFSQDAARPASGRTSHVAQTDESGTYRFRAAPGSVSVNTYPPQGFQGYLDSEEKKSNVDIVEGETVTIDFHFSRGIELHGRILTEAGEPVLGAMVSERVGYNTYGISNKLGEFTVGGQRLGKKLGLKAEHNSLQLRGMTEVEVQPGASVNIKMERYEQVEVSGRVVDRKGKLILLANIGLRNWHPHWGIGYSTTRTTTDNDGRFRKVGLIVGDEYTISAKAEGYREAETEKFTATAEMTQIADLVLFPIFGQFFVEGRITDSAGKPVSGARVYTNQEPSRQTYTGEDGGYRFEDLSTAVITELVIDHPDYAEHRFEILKTNRRHDLVLAKADGYLAGKVVDTDGKPIERAWMVASGDEDFFGYVASGTYTNALGEFDLKHIKDAIVSITVYTGHGGRKVFRDITVNQRDLVLRLKPTEPRPELTPEQQAQRKAHQAYVQETEERFKTLVNRLAPELAVAEWLSGPSVSVGDMKGKVMVLYFADFGLPDIVNVQQTDLLNLLQDVYREKGGVCVAICSAAAEIETVKQYIAEYSLAYSIGLDSPTEVIGARGETFDRYAVGWGAPFVLINRVGEITGRVSVRELESQIQTLLAD